LIPKPLTSYANFKLEVNDAILENEQRRFDPSENAKEWARSTDDYRTLVKKQALAFKKDRWGERIPRNRWSEWISGEEDQFKSEFGDHFETIKKIDQEKIDDLPDGSRLEFAYALHYRLHAEFEYFKYCENIDTEVFGAPYEELFPDPVFPKPPKPEDGERIADFGPFKLDLWPTETLPKLYVDDDEQAPLLDGEGEPKVLTAINWRTKLTKMRGRDKEKEKILEWAWGKDRKPETTKVKIMLISGPGGAGKSRLAAEVVSTLIEKENWSGGFPLRFRQGDSPTFDGSRKGVAIIIDYPEEDKDRVKQILSAAYNNADYIKPIRLILTSREDSKAWREMLEENDLPRFEETSLAEKKNPKDLESLPKANLEGDEALALAQDVATKYAERLGYPEQTFSGIEAWLNRKASHCLPLNILAASVHAVLDPQTAFKLDGNEVLIALAKHERKRVRFYSNREFKDKYILEKLLALSLFTNPGLTRSTVQALGDIDICNGKNGEALWESVKNTPYWIKKSIIEGKEKQEAHLERLEPDIVASAFLFLAMLEETPSPNLPTWLVPVVKQAKECFAHILGRIAYDVSIFDESLSGKIEQAAIEMVERSPETTTHLKTLVYQRVSTFCAELALVLCKKLIYSENEAHSLSVIFNNQADLLFRLGRFEEALYAATKAVLHIEELAKKCPQNYLYNLAIALHTKANMLSKVGRNDEALITIERSIKIFLNTTDEKKNVFYLELSSVFHSFSTLLSKVGRNSDSLLAINKSISIREQLIKLNTNKFQFELAESLNFQSTILSDLGRDLDALAAIEKAIELYSQLAHEGPDTFLSSLASSLNNQANILSYLGKQEEALMAIEDAVAIRRHLGNARPNAFLTQLGISLCTRASILSKMWGLDDALVSVKEAVSIFNEFSELFPEVFLHELASSLFLQMTILSNLGQKEEALASVENAVDIRRQITKTSDKKSQLNLAHAMYGQSNRLFELNRHEEALVVMEEALPICRRLATENTEAYLLNQATFLDKMSSILSALEKHEEEILVAEEIIGIFRRLAEFHADHYEVDLAVSQNNQAVKLSKLGKLERAYATSQSAVLSLRSRFLMQPAEYHQVMASMCVLHLETCENLAIEPDEEILNPILEILNNLANE